MMLAILAALIGLSLGVLGSGGSIVTLPVLIYVAHIEPHEAVGMSTAIVGATSLFGAFLQLRRGNVAQRPALIFSATGMIGALLGSTGTHLLPKTILMLAFAALMLVVGSLMLRRRTKARSIVCSVPRCLVVGFAVGVLTGFLGVGGGFLIVPALVFSAGLDGRQAAGTSLAIIAFNSGTALLGQLRYTHIHWAVLAEFLTLSLVGMLAGLATGQRFNEAVLRRLFAFTVIGLGIVIAILNLTAQ
jgi:uncharacterized membrane protein YfcA